MAPRRLAFSLLTFAFVCWVALQGVAKEPVLTAVTEEPVCVVDALQAFARLSVAVAHSVRVDVVAAFAGLTGADRAAGAQRVPGVTVVTQLAALTCTHSRASALVYTARIHATQCRASLTITEVLA